MIINRRRSRSQEALAPGTASERKDGEGVACPAGSGDAMLSMTDLALTDDPLALFSEWHGEADRKAYDRL